mmetsp:Transcript_10959/g.22951  ORF Transcript_10959/g.22951 Transcript_10959/m.22951 type:complete len:212 (-) Transcript_10959:3-638(-)
MPLPLVGKHELMLDLHLSDALLTKLHQVLVLGVLELVEPLRVRVLILLVRYALDVLERVVRELRTHLGLALGLRLPLGLLASVLARLEVLFPLVLRACRGRVGGAGGAHLHVGGRLAALAPRVLLNELLARLGHPLIHFLTHRPLQTLLRVLAIQLRLLGGRTVRRHVPVAQGARARRRVERVHHRHLLKAAHGCEWGLRNKLVTPKLWLG